MDGIRKHAVRIQNSSTVILGVLQVLRDPSTISLLNSRLAAVITLTFLFPFLFLSLGFNMASNTIRTEIPTPSTFVLPRYLTGGGCVYLVVLANAVVLVEIFFYSHIAHIWISVMEDDLIGKEEKGRKLQGVALMVILAVSVINPAMLFISKSGENETFIRSLAGIRTLGFFYLVKLIGFAVYAVFLHECKKAKEEQVEIVEKQDKHFGYQQRGVMMNWARGFGFYPWNIQKKMNTL